MDIFEADDNSTPLTPEEKDGLKLKWITLRSELNEAEARNIAEAQKSFTPYGRFGVFPA